MMRQADAGGSLGLWITKLHDDTPPSIMPQTFSRNRRPMLLPTALDMNSLVKHEQEYRSNPCSGPPWEISTVRTGVQIVQAMIYMSSNNLNFDRDIDDFLESVINHNMRWALKAILSPKSPTAEIFATRLLQSACRTNHPETVRLLLSVGADPNATRRHSDRPLFLALKNGCSTIVKLLLESGAEINPPRDLWWAFPEEDYLTIAVSSSNPVEMVQLLLAAGAAVSDSVLDRAARSDHIELVEMILDAAANDAQWIADCSMEK